MAVVGAAMIGLVGAIPAHAVPVTYGSNGVFGVAHYLEAAAALVLPRVGEEVDVCSRRRISTLDALGG